MKHVVFVAALLVSLLSPATPAATIEEIEAEIARREAAEKETNPFTAKRESLEKKRAKAKALQEELIEADKPFLNAAIEASEKIGNSPEISCGKKIVTIPIIAEEDEHLFTVTIEKADIAGVYYMTDTVIAKRSLSSPPPQVIIVTRPKDLVGDGDMGIVTSKANYAALLTCLDSR